MKPLTYKYVYIVSTLYCYINSWTMTRASICDNFTSEDYPNEWPYVKERFPYPIQSPNDLPISQAKPLIVKPLELYRPLKQNIGVTLNNNGYYALINIDKNLTSKPFVTSGPLFGDIYQLELMNLHWGSDDLRGSEFLIEGCPYPMEIHVVFFNCKYGSFANAQNFPDGVAALVYFGAITTNNNPDWLPLMTILPNIIEAGSSVKSDFGPLFSPFLTALGQNKSTYYTFAGSLTTPNYNECVTWMVYTEPTIPISHDQLENLRRLLKSDGTPMVNNDREIQSLNQTVFMVTEKS